MQVPISTNPILPTPGESGLLLETIQIRITIDPEPRNVRRAMEVRQTPLALSYHGTNTDVAGISGDLTFLPHGEHPRNQISNPNGCSGTGHPGNMLTTPAQREASTM